MIALALAVVVIVAGGLAYVQHRSRLKNPVIPSNNPLNTQSAKQTPSSPNSGQSQTPQSDSSSETASASVKPGDPPAVPSGDFISNHHPGGSAPTAEASTCNTTPGATCYIEFTMGDVVKKLDARTADARGTAIWYWDVKDAGLYAGSWTITAVATLNGQTKTANDAMELVVQ